MTKTLKRVIALLSVSMFMALFHFLALHRKTVLPKKIYTEDLGMALLRLSHYQKQTAWPGVQNL